MKRDVKVGLLVAAVVCGLAAMLLGGGLVGRRPESTPALSLGRDEAPAEAGPGAGIEESSTAPQEAPREAPEEIAPPPEADPVVPGEDPLAAESDGPGGRPEAIATTPDTGGAVSFDSPPQGPSAEGAIEADVAAGLEGARALVSLEAYKADEAAAESTDEPPEAVPPVEEPSIGVFETPPVTEPVAGPGADPVALEEPGVPVEDPPRLSVDERTLPPVGFSPEGPDGARSPDATLAELVAARSRPKHLYVVKQGESFFTIAKKLFGSVGCYPDILKANPDVTPKKLRPGQVIAVPDIEGAELREEFLAPPEDLKPRGPIVYLEEDTTHVVRAGETLGDIAKEYYKSAVKWPHILRANSGLDPRRLRADARIVVPALKERPGMPRISTVFVAGSRRSRPRKPRVYLAEGTVHVVDHGETLQRISKKHYGVWNKWHHILKANPGLDPKRLRPRAEIRIPALTE